LAQETPAMIFGERLIGKRVLGLGAAMTALAALGIVFTFVSRPPYLESPMAFPAGFLHGLVLGVGVALVVWNLINLRRGFMS
jgi:hypothetical protein